MTSMNPAVLAIAGPIGSVKTTAARLGRAPGGRCA